MSVRGMFIFAAAFLLMGFNLFASGFFTALNDGKTSAILSLFRTLIFLMIPLLILPGLLVVAVYGASMWLFGMNRYERSLITGPLRRVAQRLGR